MNTCILLNTSTVHNKYFLPLPRHSGVTSLYPTVVSGAGLREVISARNVGLRTADCSRFLVRECRLANGGEAD